MLKLQYALLASLCLLPLAATEAMATTAGVTAAVNQNAKSTPPGGTVRTVVLGANVVQDETIETDGGGLVQILLADGTTFTVGPNSAITIDRFVYDPNANTAQVSATIGRGVFRFIGGRTSKTEGGVQLNTPVGTVGIRGGMADLNFTGAGQIDLLFGNEVTLDGPNGSDRVFQPGYSIVFGPNGQPTVIKTPPGSANFIQQVLAGRPGQSGGSSQQPDDGKVAGSGVPGSNSGSNPPNPQEIPQPDLRAIDLATPMPNDNHHVAEGLYGSDVGKKGFSAGILISSVEGSETTYPVPLFDYAGKTRVQTNGEGAPISGTLVVGIETNYDDELYEDIFIDVIAKDRPGTISDTLGVAFNGNAIWTANATTSLTNGVGNLCSGCDFIEWGKWSSTATDGIGTLATTGNWVVGDPTTAEQYAAYIHQPSGQLSYSGDAKGRGMIVGNPEAFDVGGTMQLTWNLSSRDGDLQIIGLQGGSMTTGFDFAADISEAEMAGMFSGYGISEGSDSFMAASGSFVNDGGNIGAGVIGSFSAYHVDDTTPHFIATGVFGGILND